MENLKSDFVKDRIMNLRTSYQHPPYLLERKLILSMQQKDEAGSVAILDQINRLERARLSDSPLRSIKNSIIGSCTLFTRAVIEAGVDSESAFMLSDCFIRKIEECSNVRQTEELEYAMLREFIDLLRNSGQLKYGPVVNKAVFYIKQNIQQRIKLLEIAEAAHVHPNYLSAIFKKEVGVGISDFIGNHRADAVRQFMTETDLSLTEIADTFGFSSVAYFSNFFKKAFGLSPMKYRRMHAGHL
jgi:two-component system response regulator YesN